MVAVAGNTAVEWTLISCMASEGKVGNCGNQRALGLGYKCLAFKGEAVMREEQVIARVGSGSDLCSGD